MMDLNLLSEEVRRKMLACAEEAVPSEMCGVLVFSYGGYEFLPLSNCAENPHETFEISADDWMAAERVGEIVAVVHSHPRGEPFLSGADRRMQVETGLPWILVTQGRLKLFRPVPHLRGRVFEYGKTDCGALVRDAFMLMGLVFPNHPRGDIDEDAAAGFLEKHLENCGFSRVSDGLCAGDVVLTATGGHASHAVLYLGNDWMLHHAYNQLSCRVPYTRYWADVTHSVWRHPDFEPAMMQALENDFIHMEQA